jgi:hypothetical protein
VEAIRGHSMEITSQKPPQMLLVQDDHVVEAFATHTPDAPFIEKSQIYE